MWRESAIVDFAEDRVVSWAEFAVSRMVEVAVSTLVVGSSALCGVVIPCARLTGCLLDAVCLDVPEFLAVEAPSWAFVVKFTGVGAIEELDALLE
jgi:hypothetical protein